MRDEPDDIFWERLASMPWRDGVELARARREVAQAKYALLLGKSATKVEANQRASLQASLHRLNEYIANTNRKLNDLTWGKAVTAVFGQEGYEACRIWMVHQECGNDPRPRSPSGGG